MTNVSKQPLATKAQKQLFEQFAALLALTSTAEASGLYYELFTPAERVMFVKRIAVIALLQQSYSPYRIAVTLHMSETTVAKIMERYDKGAFETIQQLLQKRNFNRDVFWKTLELLLTAGMPSQGRGRWRSFYTHNKS